MTEAVYRQRVADQARDLVFSAAAPFAPHENITQRRMRATERLGQYGVPAWRIEAAWQGKAGDWAGWALELLKDAHEQWKQDAERRGVAARELDAARLRALSSRIAATDADFHDGTLRAVERVLAQHRGGRS